MELIEVLEALAPAKVYWVATAGPEGPHAAPVWGAISEGALVLFTDRRSRKARNAAGDPRAVIHLESGEEVLIVHGRLVDLGNPLAHPRAMEALSLKYHEPGEADYLPGVDSPYDLLWRLEPTRALAWSLEEFDGSQRRWSA
jgi:nitroimidazol reductase NimA-like FMN-containing flavoprotein (pyridoxamine 5'-phosphate oxidase superfamily)